MTFKVVIPYYTNIHLLRNCMAGMDINWNHILIVDNSATSEAQEFEGKGATIVYYPENIGVAKSWNMGLKAGCDWTFVIGIAAVFPNGFSEVLLDVCKGSDFAFITDLSYHCNAISKKLVDLIGYLDENFYPAYYEDADYDRRMSLSGVHEPNITIPGYSALMANSVTSDKGLPVHYLHLQEYYIQKWGGKPGEETFTHPFNDEANDIKYWKGETLATLKERYELNSL